MLEYAHLAVRLDLEKAIGKVKEACENIQRSTEHMRRKAEGMDIHAREGDGVDYADYSYDEEEEQQDVTDEEEEKREGTSSGGMSNVEKALVAAELAMLGKKVHGFVQGRKDGSVTEDQSTICLLYTSPSPRD